MQNHDLIAKACEAQQTAAYKEPQSAKDIDVETDDIADYLCETYKRNSELREALCDFVATLDPSDLFDMIVSVAEGNAAHDDTTACIHSRLHGMYRDGAEEMLRIRAVEQAEYEEDR